MKEQKYLTKETELVLAVMEHAVYGRNGRIGHLIKNKDIDWTLFRKNLVYHELLPFAYCGLKDFFSFLPQDMVKALSATYHYYLNYNLLLERIFLNLETVFKENNVLFIPIKGIAFLEDLYLRCPVRMVTDIDVLVRKKDIKRAVEILNSSGFEKKLDGLKEDYWLKKQYHYVFIKKERDGASFILEMHWDIDYPRKRKEFVSGMFNRLRDFQMQNKTVQLLSPEDSLFVLALHQRHFGKSLGLKYACDTALLLNKYGPVLDWDYILSQSKKNKTRSSLFFALYQAKFWLDAEIPVTVWKELSKNILWDKGIKRFTAKNTFSLDRDPRALYLKKHFLLYDTIYEPVAYILNIPLEQFARFYGLEPYAKKTIFLYHFRVFYIFIMALACFKQKKTLPTGAKT